MSEPIVVKIGRNRYRVDKLSLLDANLAHCPPEHRDALLDARTLLYPNGQRSELLDA